MVTADFVDRAHREGLLVHVWTVNEAERMQALFDLGVDGIVTDDVATGLDVLNRQRPRRHRGMGE